ncbi:MAG: hypothetical protein VXA26_03930 [Candidatus Neomarinimicrobiota bacterium]
MILKKSIIYKFIFSILNLTLLFSEGVWVKYGWELFHYVVDAQTASLGSAVTAYNTNSIHSSLVNPSFVSSNKNFSITHQSRFSGIVNNDLFGIQLKSSAAPINLNFLYQGVSNIPDTRDMLLDWGLDGQFGTNDIGEGNGVIDEGERLNEEKLKFFNQHQLGFHGAFKSNIFGLKLGLGLKLLGHFLDDHHAIGMGLDIGYNKKISKSTIGLVARNLPASGLIWDSGTVEGTKPSLSFGLHHPINYFDKIHLQINTMMNVDMSLSNTNLYSQIRYKNFSIDDSYGIELIYQKSTMIRFGRNTNNDSTGGIGLRWKNFGIDYAFLGSLNNSALGNHHLISLIISSNWIFSMLTAK